ncbi:MAG: chloramphenicol phosphotransferase [Gammaproteobacteria bacterium]
MSAEASDALGRIVVLNGAPRAGKSSIASAIQETFEEPWMHFGVDVWRRMTPARYQPGIGLRPGGERPDLEPLIVVWYRAMYDTDAVHSRAGLNVVVDAGHHDSYSVPRNILFDCARRLDGLPALFVGVRCPVEVIMARRREAPDRYVTNSADEPVPEPVLRWEREVHRPGIYDLEVDTSRLSSQECAEAIRRRLENPPRPSALEKLLALAIQAD